MLCGTPSIVISNSFFPCPATEIDEPLISVLSVSITFNFEICLVVMSLSFYAEKLLRQNRSTRPGNEGGQKTNNIRNKG